MCNWGWMGGGMWWPHGFGFLGGLLMLAALIFVIYLFLKMFNSPAGQKCPSCQGRIQAAFLRCPHCGAALKHHCRRCSTIIETGWQYCPSCEAGINETKDSD